MGSSSRPRFMKKAHYAIAKSFWLIRRMVLVEFWSTFSLWAGSRLRWRAGSSIHTLLVLTSWASICLTGIMITRAAPWRRIVWAWFAGWCPRGFVRLPAVVFACFWGDRVINPRKGFVQLSSKNITCNSVLQLEEVCTYTRAKDAPASSTHFRQELKISAFVWGVAGRLKALVETTFWKTPPRDVISWWRPWQRFRWQLEVSFLILALW